MTNHKMTSDTAYLKTLRWNEKLHEGKSENLRLWLTAKDGRVLWFREKLIQWLAESDMIDEKKYFHPSWRRNWILRLPIQRRCCSGKEKYIPVVFLCGWLFCGFGHYWMVWLWQGKSSTCADFLRWRVMMKIRILMIFLLEIFWGNLDW